MGLLVALILGLIGLGVLWVLATVFMAVVGFFASAFMAAIGAVVAFFTGKWLLDWLRKDYPDEDKADRP